MPASSRQSISIVRVYQTYLVLCNVLKIATMILVWLSIIHSIHPSIHAVCAVALEPIRAVIIHKVSIHTGRAASLL